MAKAANPARPARPTAVARAAAPVLDEGGDDVVAAASEAPLLVAEPVLEVPDPPEVDLADVDCAEVSVYNHRVQAGFLRSWKRM